MRRKYTPNQYFIEGDSSFIILADAEGNYLAEAAIDLEDLGLVLPVGRWMMNNGYAKARKGRVLLHRLVMHCPDDMMVDHKNHDTLDCRKANLRICTHTENMMNRNGAHGHSESKIRNVRWCNNKNRWIVVIRANGKRHHIGQYRTQEEAARAAEEARLRLHGEFAS